MRARSGLSGTGQLRVDRGVGGVNGEPRGVAHAGNELALVGRRDQRGMLLVGTYI